MDYQIPSFVQEIEEIDVSIPVPSVKEIEEKARIARENRVVYKLLGGERIYEKGLFTVKYAGNIESPGCFLRSYAMQKFHPKRQDTLTPIEEIERLQKEGCKDFWIHPAIKLFSRTGEEIVESHTITFALYGHLAQRINAGTDLFSEEVLYLLEKELPILKIVKPFAVLADGNDKLYLIYTFTDNIMSRKNDIKMIYTLLSDMTGMKVNVNSSDFPCDMPFPCPNMENKKTGVKCKVYWNQKYKITTSTAFMALIEEKAEECSIDKKIYSREGKLVSSENIVDLQEYCKNHYGKEFKAENPEYSEPMPVRYNKNEGVSKRNKANLYTGFAKNANTNIADMNFWTFCAVINKADKYVHKNIHTVKDVDYSKTPGKFLRDLRQIFEERNGNLDGMQKAFIYHLAVTMIWCRANDQEVRTIVNEYNRKMKTPLPPLVIREIVNERLKNRGKERISAKKIAAELHLSDAFILNRAQICYNKDRILARKRKASEKANAYRRKKTAERRNVKIKALKTVYQNGGSYKDMEKASGWSRNTVKKYLKLIIVELKEKYEKWLEKQNLKAGQADKCSFVVAAVPTRYERISKAVKGEEQDVWIARLGKAAFSQEENTHIAA